LVNSDRPQPWSSEIRVASSNPAATSSESGAEDTSRRRNVGTRSAHARLAQHVEHVRDHARHLDALGGDHARPVEDVEAVGEHQRAAGAQRRHQAEAQGVGVVER
jgi:hypothetical protein